jgi:hypothetical protein
VTSLVRLSLILQFRRDPPGGNFTPAALQQALARHPRAPVKAVLLDQTAGRPTRPRARI